MNATRTLLLSYYCPHHHHHYFAWLTTHYARLTLPQAAWCVRVQIQGTLHLVLLYIIIHCTIYCTEYLVKRPSASSWAQPASFTPDMMVLSCKGVGQNRTKGAVTSEAIGQGGGTVFHLLKYECTKVRI